MLLNNLYNKLFYKICTIFNTPSKIYNESHFYNNFFNERITPENIMKIADQIDPSFLAWCYTKDLRNIWLLPEWFLMSGIIYFLSYVTYLLILKNKIVHTDILKISKDILKFFYFLAFITVLLAWLILIYKKTIFYSGFLLINFFTLSTKAFISLLSIFMIYFIQSWYLKTRRNITEIYILFMGSIFFSFLLVSSTNLFLTYTVLEGVGAQSYTLAVFTFTEIAIDVVLKYFLLGSLASGILLYGISLIYGTCNTLNYFDLRNYMFSHSFIDLTGYTMPLLTKVGMLFIFFGLLFKVGAYPMHVWVPGVYRNSPNPITIFLATIIKFLMSLLIIRLFYSVFDSFLVFFKFFFLISALGSMFVGALGAFKELKIKNFISYTSINQAGFILLGLCCQTELGIMYSMYYLFIYIIITIGFLGLILNMKQYLTNQSPRYFKDLKHLCKDKPMTALILSAFVLSFAGLPPFAGFFGKLYIYLAIAKAKLLTLLLVTLFLNVISLYYYVRIIKSLWFENLLDFDKEYLKHRLTPVWGVRFLIFICTIFNIFFIFITNPYMNFIKVFFLNMSLIY